MARTNWLIGNWKMNGDLALLEDFAKALEPRFGRHAARADMSLGLAVPDLLLYPAAGILSGLPLTLGVQTCAASAKGAHTGETSPVLAAELGARLVVLGHSERRVNQGETSADVRAKAKAAQAATLLPVICVGESLKQRQAGSAHPQVMAQVQASCPDHGPYLIAYEPLWAIGTGQVASPFEAQSMHAAIRQALPDATTPILYGGSLKPDNATDLLSQPDIDGGLVGGASLQPEDLLAIYAAAA